MSKKVVYVTGCLGFIGYHVAKSCIEQGWHVIGVDKLTYAANIQFLPELQKHSHLFKFIESDINDLDMLYDCDYIINTAAETHVDNSIISSDVFLKSNVNGVHHLLNLIKERYRFKMPTLLHFSTDEVYGDIVEGSHVETDMLKPSNPYSATKAAADMLVTAWARTFKVPYIIVRPTNNYGIGQYTEKFIPKSIKSLYLGRPIPLHDEGKPRRTWLHVSDTANAIITIINAEVQNEIYNISGNYEEQNLVIAMKICDEYSNNKIDYMNQLYGDDDRKYINQLDLSISRPGQDVRYSINDSKLRELGWEPRADFYVELKKIVEYYRSNFVW